jgi:hypothetical protein
MWTKFLRPQRAKLHGMKTTRMSPAPVYQSGVLLFSQMIRYPAKLTYNAIQTFPCSE